MKPEWKDAPESVHALPDIWRNDVLAHERADGGMSPGFLAGLKCCADELDRALRGAVPVYQLRSADFGDAGWYDVNAEAYRLQTEKGREGRILYTAPPAPAASVPEGLRPAAFNESAHITVMTYTSQPGNVEAWRFGEARAMSMPGGDYIDGGLSLLRELHARGYGIVRVSALQSPTTPEPTHADR